MERIIKNQLVTGVSEKTGYTKENVQVIIDSFLDELKESLKNGNTIELRGFGTFETKIRKGKENARNPKTGEKLSVPSHYVARFRPGKEISEALSEMEIE